MPNIWKERNRRTFRQEEKTVTELTYLIKEDVQQFQQVIEVVNRVTPTSAPSGFFLASYCFCC